MKKHEVQKALGSALLLIERRKGSEAKAEAVPFFPENGRQGEVEAAKRFVHRLDQCYATFMRALEIVNGAKLSDDEGTIRSALEQLPLLGNHLTTAISEARMGVERHSKIPAEIRISETENLRQEVLAMKEHAEMLLELVHLRCLIELK